MRIVIPLFDQFTALDAVGPYQVLSEIPGAEVVIAAAQRGPVRSDTGTLAIVADASLQEVDNCEVLVVPGGAGARGAATDETFLGWGSPGPPDPRGDPLGMHRRSSAVRPRTAAGARGHHPQGSRRRTRSVRRLL